MSTETEYLRFRQLILGSPMKPEGQVQTTEWLMTLHAAVRAQGSLPTQGSIHFRL